MTSIDAEDEHQLDELDELDHTAFPREERLNRSGSPNSLCALVSQPITKSDSKPDHRRTNRLVPVEEIKAEQERKAKEASDHMMDLRRMLEYSDPTKSTFVIAHLTIIAGPERGYYIAGEIGLTAFNLEDGIIDNYWSLIDHEEIKLGFTLDVERDAPKVGLPIPPFDYRCRDYEKIISNIDQFMQKHLHLQSTTPKIYCLQQYTNQVSASMRVLYDQCNKDNPYPVHSLEQLVRCISAIGAQGDWRSWYDPGHYEDEAQDIPGEGGVQDIPGEDEVQDIPGEDEVQDIPGEDEVQDIPGGDEPQDIPGEDEVQDIPGEDEVQDIPGEDEVQDIPGEDEVQIIPGGDEVQDIPGGDEVQIIPGGDEVQDIPGGDEPQDIPGGDEPQDIPGGDEDEDIDDPDLWDSVSIRGSEPAWGRENFQYESPPFLTTDQMANEWLNSDRYAYTKGVGCPYHWSSDNNSISCALNVTNRLAYNAIFVLFPYFGLETMYISYHCTHDRYESNEVARRMEILSDWDIPVYYKKDFIKHRKNNDSKNAIASGSGPSTRVW